MLYEKLRKIKFKVRREKNRITIGFFAGKNRLLIAIEKVKGKGKKMDLPLKPFEQLTLFENKKETTQIHFNENQKYYTYEIAVGKWKIMKYSNDVNFTDIMVGYENSKKEAMERIKKLCTEDELELTPDIGKIAQ